MSDKIFLIGNKSDFKAYEQNTNNIDTLPVANLPMTYFPFFYNNSETSIEKMKRLVPLIENKTEIDVDGVVAKNTIDTDKLFSLLTNLEESYQPFNNNLIFHIKIVVIIIWFIVFLAILKYISYILGEKYSYFILFMILMLLIISTIWALAITSRSY
jgi:hypothetical protein